MPKFLDLTGKVFGKLIVKCFAEKKSGQNRWLCVCECGNHTVKSTRGLMSNKSKHCGCEVVRFKPRHGMSHTKVHRTWAGIKQRCLNPTAQMYPVYGGAGIGMCEQWANSFESFYAHVGDPPDGKYSIDRIDGSKGYEPGNVRWATDYEQNNNNNANIRITYNGITLTTAQWGRALGGSRYLVWCRIKNGWDVEKAVTTPAKKRRKPEQFKGIERFMPERLQR